MVEGVRGRNGGEERRRLWREIALTAAFTAVLISFTAAATWVAGHFLSDANSQRAFTVIVLLVVVAFLVYYAHPGEHRRWYHWVGYELCVFLVVLFWIPLVYLPWLIVTRRASRVASGRQRVRA